MSQVFYQTDTLSINQKIELINRALKNHTSAWVDERLPGQVARQRSNLSFNEILIKLSQQNCHFVFIDRGEDNFSLTHYFEIGFSTLEGLNSYFLFIYVEPIIAQELIKVFNLKPMR